MLEREVQASKDRYSNAEALSEYLYKLWYENRPALPPEDVAFELYSRVLSGGRRPAIIIWKTDDPAVIIKKLDALKTAKVQALDENTNRVVGALMNKAMELCPDRTSAMYATKELITSVRFNEHMLPKTGVIILQGWPDAKVDLLLKRLVGKNTKELREESEPPQVRLYEDSVPGPDVLCLRCKKRHAVHFDRMNLHRPGMYNIDACCGEKDCCKIGVRI